MRNLDVASFRDALMSPRVTRKLYNFILETPKFVITRYKNRSSGISGGSESPLGPLCWIVEETEESASHHFLVFAFARLRAEGLKMMPGALKNMFWMECNSKAKSKMKLGAPHFDKQNEGGVRSTLLPLDPLNFKNIVTKVIQSNHAHK